MASDYSFSVDDQDQDYDPRNSVAEEGRNSADFAPPPLKKETVSALEKYGYLDEFKAPAGKSRHSRHSDFHDLEPHDQDDHDDDDDDLDDDDAYEDDDVDEDDGGLAVRSKPGKTSIKLPKRSRGGVYVEGQQDEIDEDEDEDLDDTTWGILEADDDMASGRWTIMGPGEEEDEEEEDPRITELRERKLSLINFEKEGLVLEYLRVMRIHHRHMKQNLFLEDYLYKLCVRKRLFVPEGDIHLTKAEIRKQNKLKRHKKKFQAKIKANFEAFSNYKPVVVKTGDMPIRRRKNVGTLKRLRKVMRPNPIPPSYESRLDTRVVTIKGVQYQRMFRSRGRNWKIQAEQDDTKREIRAFEHKANKDMHYEPEHVHLHAPDVRMTRTVVRFEETHPEILQENIWTPPKLADIAKQRAAVLPKLHPYDPKFNFAEGMKSVEALKQKHKPHGRHSRYHFSVKKGKDAAKFRYQQNQHHHHHHHGPGQHQHMHHHHHQDDEGGDGDEGDHDHDHNNPMAKKSIRSTRSHTHVSMRSSKHLKLFRKASARKSTALGTALPVLTKVTRAKFCHIKPRAPKKFNPLTWFEDSHLKGRGINGDIILSSERHHLLHFAKMSELRGLSHAQRRSIKRQSVKRHSQNLQTDWESALGRLRVLIAKKHYLEDQHTKLIQAKTMDWSLWKKRNREAVEGLKTILYNFVAQPYISQKVLHGFEPGLEEFSVLLDKFHDSFLHQVEKMYKSEYVLILLQRKVKDKTNQELANQGYTLMDLELKVAENKDLYQKVRKKEHDLAIQREKNINLIRNVVVTRDKRELTERGLTEDHNIRKTMNGDLHTGQQALQGALRHLKLLEQRNQGIVLQGALIERTYLFRDFLSVKDAMSKNDKHKKKIARELYLRERELNMMKIKTWNIKRNIRLMKMDAAKEERLRKAQVHIGRMNGNFKNLIKQDLAHCGGPTPGPVWRY